MKKFSACILLISHAAAQCLNNCTDTAHIKDLINDIREQKPQIKHPKSEEILSTLLGEESAILDANKLDKTQLQHLAASSFIDQGEELEQLNKTKAISANSEDLDSNNERLNGDDLDNSNALSFLATSSSEKIFSEDLDANEHNHTNIKSALIEQNSTQENAKITQAALLNAAKLKAQTALKTSDDEATEEKADSRISKIEQDEETQKADSRISKIEQDEELKQQISAKLALGAVAMALRAGDKERAFELAKKTCALRCDDLALNFAMIKTAMDIGDDDAALAASDRVLIYDPHNATAHLAAAQIYKQQGNEELLAMELDELKGLNLSPAQKIAFNKLSAKKYEFYGDISVGVGIESNAKHLNKDDFTYHTPFGNLKIEKDDIDAASAGIFMANLGVFNRISDKASNDFSVSNYTKKFFKPRSQEYSNISIFSINENFNYKLNQRFSLAMILGYDYALLKSNPYSHTFSAQVALNTLLNNGWALKTGLVSSTGSFVQDQDKADRYIHYGAYEQVSKSFAKALIYARIFAERERANNSENISADFNQIGLNLGSVYQINELFRVNAGLSLLQNNYLRYHPGFENYRKDKILRLSTELDYALSANQSILFNVGFVNQRSNQGLYEYDNYTAMIMYRLQF